MLGKLPLCLFSESSELRRRRPEVGYNLSQCQCFLKIIHTIIKTLAIFDIFDHGYKKLVDFLWLAGFQ